MDGLSAVTARISEIRALMQPAAVPAASTAAPTATRGATGMPAVPVAAVPSGRGGSFADALAQAVRQPVGPTAGPSATSSAGVPVAGVSVADLKATYRNGRVPADALMPIGHGDHRLAAPAAAAFSELEAAARRDGVRFGVTDSYRSYDAQVDVARRKGLYSQGGLAAQPGTSQHGWGLAVDLDLDARAQAWMRANGARFGFVEDTPREPWHWAFSA